MHVVYSGPIDSVEIAELGLTAPRGKVVEVPDELGKRLCEQSVWEQANTPKPAVSEEN